MGDMSAGFKSVRVKIRCTVHIRFSRTACDVLVLIKRQHRDTYLRQSLATRNPVLYRRHVGGGDSSYLFKHTIDHARTAPVSAQVTALPLTRGALVFFRLAYKRLPADVITHVNSSKLICPSMGVLSASFRFRSGTTSLTRGLRLIARLNAPQAIHRPAQSVASLWVSPYTLHLQSTLS